MNDVPVAPKDYGLDHDVANFVNDRMLDLHVGNKPAIARDGGLLDHAVTVAEDILLGKVNYESGKQSVENAIMLADSNQAELLADFDILRRSAFYRKLRTYIRGLIQREGVGENGLVLLMTDGNGLKKINDSTSSHALGDEFIRMWADELSANLRQGQGDVIFQYGSGDELAGMLEFKSLDNAVEILNGDSGRISLIKNKISARRDELARTTSNFPKDDLKECGTLAIGWAWISNNDLLKLNTEFEGNLDKLVSAMYRNADQAMYLDKEGFTRSN